MGLERPSKFDDGEEWRPVPTYAYNEARRKSDRRLLTLRLREFFTFSRLKYAVLRKASFKRPKERPTYVRCAGCDFMFREDSVEVDHITPIHTAQTLPQLVELLLDEKNLQVLCRTCHRRKTIDQGKKK